jgi:intein/homing endonuclease
MYDIVAGRSPSDLKKFGLKGSILIGKQYIKMGQVTTLSNKIYMDIAGAHVVFICGKRGGGKCLLGDSLVNLEDGSLVRIDKLEKDPRNLFSISNQLKIQISKKEFFYKRKVNRILEIRLNTGKEIRLTPEHPLFTVSGWIPVENLGIGDRIATPRKVDFFGNIDIKEYKIKLLAYLIAEGHLSNNFVLFTNKARSIINDFKQSVLEFNKNLVIKPHGNCSIRISEGRKRTCNKALRGKNGEFLKGSIFPPYNSLINWLKEIGLYGKLSPNKFIPDIIFTLPKNRLALFLNRLFSCDGSIFKDKENANWKISYSSSSNELIKQVHHLLLRFGVVSRIRDKIIKLNNRNHLSYELDIKGEFVNIFLNEIGFYGPKESRQKIALIDSISIIRNTNIDTIPKEIWNSFRPKNWATVGKSFGYLNPKSLRSSINYSPSRQKLGMIAEIENDEIMSNLANSDIFWDRIISIKEINGEFDVYDLTVPENHNFIANDIIVHNSYTMGVIAEGLSDLEPDVKQNVSIILLDTMGIYWTMKYPNHKDETLLKEWGLESKGINVKIFTPLAYYEKFKEEGIPTDYPFSLDPSELDQDDWCHAFKQDKYSKNGTALTKTVLQLKEKGKRYNLDDMVKFIRDDGETEKEVKDAVMNMFELAKGWGVFSDNPTPINDLAKAGEVTVLDVSCYATQPGGWDIKALIVGIIAQHLFAQRMSFRKGEEYKSVHKALHYFGEEEKAKLDMPLVWLVVDEAHEFLPRDPADANAATYPLVVIMREGRQPGISLILATQQPGKIHTDVMTQSDIVLSHRITAKVDVEALGTLMQSYMREGLTEQLDNLPRDKGSAILFDDQNERMYPVRIRPRFTWHGGGSPTAVPEVENRFKL